jgi:hypothetical protein
MAGSRRFFGLAARAVMLISLAGPLGAQTRAGVQTRAVTGQAGILAEWDLTATVTEQAGGSWAGSLSLKHVGFCSVDEPEEKTGELRLLISKPPGEVVATMLIDGVTCMFSGRLKETYDGTMRCPDRRDVPMMLLIE